MALNFCRRAGSLPLEDLIRDRWVLRILEAMFRGAENFDTLQMTLGIARNILADRLKMMTAKGLLERVRGPEDMRLVCYRLTQMGRDAQPVVAALRSWIERYDPDYK